MSEACEKVHNMNAQVNVTNFEFVLRHVFNNLSEMWSWEEYENRTEYHSGMPWSISISYENGVLRVVFFRNMIPIKNVKPIDTEFEINLHYPYGISICKTASHFFKKADENGLHEFTWEPIEMKYFVHDELSVKIRVKTVKTIGLYQENLRSFNDKERSFVTLVVDNRRFHVVKSHLSTHSSYFKSLFLGGYDESKKSEIKLSGVDGEDLQDYLEALYGEDAINDVTVEGILLVADKYDTKILVQKCERFLLENSEKTLGAKRGMAVKYNLSALKNNCISEFKTIEDDSWSFRM
ncbi:unnamed protein product [Caenorhabditis brenneri]